MELLNDRQGCIGDSLACNFSSLLQVLADSIWNEKVVCSALVSQKPSGLRADWPVQVIGGGLKCVGVLVVRCFLCIGVDWTGLVACTGDVGEIVRRIERVVAGGWVSLS